MASVRSIGYPYVFSDITTPFHAFPIMYYRNKPRQSACSTEGILGRFAQLGFAWQKKQQYLVCYLLGSCSQKLSAKSPMPILLKILLAGSLLNTILFAIPSAHADDVMPEGWGRLSADQAKMINFGLFSGQIIASCTFASFGHLPPVEARKAIKASLDLATAKYGNLFAKAVGWNVRRTYAKECSPVWPAGYWQYFPERPFSLN